MASAAGIARNIYQLPKPAAQRAFQLVHSEFSYIPSLLVFIFHMPGISVYILLYSTRCGWESLVGVSTRCPRGVLRCEQSQSGILLPTAMIERTACDSSDILPTHASDGRRYSQVCLGQQNNDTLFIQMHGGLCTCRRRTTSRDYGHCFTSTSRLWDCRIVRLSEWTRDCKTVGL